MLNNFKKNIAKKMVDYIRWSLSTRPVLDKFKPVKGFEHRTCLEQYYIRQHLKR